MNVHSILCYCVTPWSEADNAMDSYNESKREIWMNLCEWESIASSVAKRGYAALILAREMAIERQLAFAPDKFRCAMDTWFSSIRINSMWMSTADRLSGFTFIYFIVNCGWRNQLMQLTTDESVIVSHWCAQHICGFFLNLFSIEWTLRESAANECTQLRVTEE